MDHGAPVNGLPYFNKRYEFQVEISNLWAMTQTVWVVFSFYK